MRPHFGSEEGHAHRFRPGQSGNAAGRPRKVLSEAYRKQLEAPLSPAERQALRLPVGSVVADGIAKTLTRKALRGSEACAKELREAVEGKAPVVQLIDGQEFHVQILYDAPSDEQLREQARPHELPAKPADFKALIPTEKTESDETA
jgi:hypothetical protein